MVKKRLQEKTDKKSQLAVRSKGITKKVLNHRSTEVSQLNKKRTTEKLNRSNEAKPKNTKNDVCSICLNQIQRPSLCSGCFHHFCFSCIAKWANVSNNCPVCRKEYKNILHNFNTSVKIIKLDAESNDQEQSVARDDSQSTNEHKSRSGNEPFYIFEAGSKQMIGVPIIDKKKITNNIVLLDTNSTRNIPEIDIVNLTRNENGSRIITRHNYQLASIDQQEFINELITSAINRSVEEHNETIAQIDSKEKQSIPILNENEDLTRLVDIYSFDRITDRKQRGRTRNNFSTQSRYNLRPIEGARINPLVNRARLIDWRPS